MKFDLEKFKSMLKLANDPKYPYSMHEATDLIIMAGHAANRIEELESLLVESKAISLHNFQRYQAAIGEGHISNMDHRISWDGLSEERRKAIMEVHREMLHMEGKL